jgi:predicted GIY-YIG superfamily endonuclease
MPKPHLNNAKTTKRENEDAKTQVKDENPKTSSVIATSPHFKSRYKGLQAALEHIMPSEVHARLIDNPKLCVASCVTNPNKRCGWGTRRQPTNDHKLSKTVSCCIERDDYATLPEYLEQLVKALLCSTHQNVALYQPKAKSRIDELRDFILNLPQASEEDLSTFREWTMALANCSLPTPVYCSAREKPPTAVAPKTNTTAASCSKITSDLPGFLPYKPTRMNDLAISKALKDMIAKPLSKVDMKDGFIYIFWDQGSFGMVKIGRTNNLERRLKEWNKCKSTHSYHKSSRDGELLKVPHVQRIERLMQIELINTRKTRACDTCAKTKFHKEWFEITEAKAVEVFQKWRNWILQEPYVENDEGKWVIRPEMLETLPENCKLEPEKVQGPRIRPRAIKNRPKRPVLRRLPAMQASGASHST